MSAVQYCATLPFMGLGFYAQAGFAINLHATTMDASLVHELGHNLGIHHASFADADGSRGGVAWFDQEGPNWTECASKFAGLVFAEANFEAVFEASTRPHAPARRYANPFSVLGRQSSDVTLTDISFHFLAEAKVATLDPAAFCSAPAPLRASSRQGHL